MRLNQHSWNTSTKKSILIQAESLFNLRWRKKKGICLRSKDQDRELWKLLSWYSTAAGLLSALELYSQTRHHLPISEICNLPCKAGTLKLLINSELVLKKKFSKAEAEVHSPEGTNNSNNEQCYKNAVVQKGLIKIAGLYFHFVTGRFNFPPTFSLLNTQ